jgi:hypothetical protein
MLSSVHLNQLCVVKQLSGTLGLSSKKLFVSATSHTSPTPAGSAKPSANGPYVDIGGGGGRTQAVSDARAVEKNKHFS